MTMEDMAAFHAKYIKGRPMSVIFCADMRKVSLDQLKKYWKLQEVRFDQMFKF